jgi:hypothetical protein
MDQTPQEKVYGCTIISENTCTLEFGNEAEVCVNFCDNGMHNGRHLLNTNYNYLHHPKQFHC